jgi:hypothetical protein
MHGYPHAVRTLHARSLSARCAALRLSVSCPWCIVAHSLLPAACSGCDLHEGWRKQQAADFGALETTVCAMQKFPEDTQLLHAALMALTVVAGGTSASANRRKLKAGHAGALARSKSGLGCLVSVGGSIELVVSQQLPYPCQ